MAKTGVRKTMLFSFGVTAMVILLSSAAFACTVFRGTMTVRVVGDSGIGSFPASGTSTAEGNDVGMGFCNGPRLTGEGGNASAVAQVDGTITPASSNDDAPDDIYVDVEITVAAGTSCNAASKLNGDSYFVSWHPSFAVDCMVQGLGTPAYIDPKLLAIQNGATVPSANRIYRFDAIGQGPTFPDNPQVKYAGVCITRATGGSGVLDGNRAPIRVV